MPWQNYTWDIFFRQKYVNYRAANSYDIDVFYGEIHLPLQKHNIYQ